MYLRKLEFDPCASSEIPPTLGFEVFKISNAKRKNQKQKQYKTVICIL